MRTRLLLLVVPFLIIVMIFAGAVHFATVNNTDTEAFAEKTADNTASEPAASPAEAKTTALPSESTATAVEEQQPQTTKLDNTLSLTVVGDILLGRGVEKSLKNINEDFPYVFEKVSDLLKRGDVVFGNLEEPITDREHSLTGIGSGGKWVLRSRTAAFSAIQLAGFNLLSLANNHILDYYAEGLNDTMNILDANGILHTGAGNNLDEARKLAVIEKKGLKIGLLAYTDMADITYKGNPPLNFLAGKGKAGVAPRRLEMIKEDIQKARGSVDILLVSLHWGVEDSFAVQPSQKEFAYQLLDSGADMIIGHHPHQFQGIELHNGKPIFYSLGNFMFDQNDPENQESFVLNLKYEDKKIKEMTAYPIRTINKCQVVPQEGQGAAALIDRELGLCKELGTQCEKVNDTIVFKIN